MNRSFQFLSRYNSIRKDFPDVPELTEMFWNALLNEDQGRLIKARRQAQACVDLMKSDDVTPVKASLALRAIFREIEREFDFEVGRFIDLTAVRREGEKTVVFVSTYWNYKMLREAAALKKLGYRCFALILTGEVKAVSGIFSETFDEVVCRHESWLWALAAIHAMKADVIHIHCSMWSYFFAAAALCVSRKSVKTICEFDDMTGIYWDLARRSEIGDANAVRRYELDYAMEGFICRHAHGVVHQLHPRVELDIRDRHGGVPEICMMQPYPLEGSLVPPSGGGARNGNANLSGNARNNAARSGMRLVWAGQVWVPNPDTRDIFPSSGLLSAIDAFLSRGFSFDILLDPGKPFDPEDPVWRDYRQFEKTGRFTIAPGPDTLGLPERLADYDFGNLFFLKDFNSLKVRRLKIESQIPNKFFSFMEAGLPVIVNREFRFISELVERWGLGLVLDQSDMDTCVERMRMSDISSMRKNVMDFARSHTMETMIHGLRTLYGHMEAEPERRLPPLIEYLREEALCRMM